MSLRGMTAAALLMTAVVARADTYQYTYTGNDFTFAQAPFTANDCITGFFIAAAPLASNVTVEEITPVAFSFSDGLDTISNTSNPSSVDFVVGTDNSGNIARWSITVLLPGTKSTGYTAALFTQGNLDGQSQDAAGRDGGAVFASNSQDPGSWTETTLPSQVPTPEPESIVLLGSGSLALAGAIRRRARSPEKSSPHCHQP